MPSYSLDIEIQCDRIPMSLTVQAIAFNLRSLQRCFAIPSGYNFTIPTFMIFGKRLLL